MTTSSGRLALLLGVTVALAASLALEAERATRSHQVTADRALRDYAAVAAWEFLTASEDGIDRGLAAALGPVTGMPAASPYDSLPPPSALTATADRAFQCGPTQRAVRFFSVDFRTGALATDGTAGPSERAIGDSLSERSHRGALRAGQYGVVWTGGDAVGLYGIKSLGYSGYAVRTAPIAAYGIVTCRQALVAVFDDVLARHPLLPRSVTGGLPNTELAGVEVFDPAGRSLYRSGPGPVVGAYDGLAQSGGFGVRLTLSPSVAGRLVVSRPGSRVPLLLGLLLLTAGLAAVGVRQHRREQELVRLRADFISSVSHELRTPLTQILLFGETLELDRAVGEEARRQALGIILQEARRLVHLVDNVLQFSRVERRLVTLEAAPLRLAPFLREIMERFVPLAGQAAVRLRADLDEGIVLPADPACLHQMVINLLENAVKHGGRSGGVLIRTGLHGSWARIDVEDEGPGIPAADRERIWEPFVRLHRPGSAAGSGIGLAVVRSLVQAHGGRCGVEAPESGGARFYLELPGATMDSERGTRQPGEEAVWRGS